MRPLVVQLSNPDPKPTTNPYVVMLLDALAAHPGVEPRTFTWRRALLGRYDVFHAHWPEILVGGASPAKALARQALTALLLLRWRLTGTPLVRTVHNLDLPEGIPRRAAALLRAVERRTAVRIVLTPTTPVPPGAAVELAPHGDYRRWFARHPVPAPVPGRLAYVGLVRRYKRVDVLLDAFRATPGALTLEVAGRPSTPELEAQVRALAARDERVSLTLRHLEDAELVRVVGEAELVVLPYASMHNSGTVLAALSLGRPVLVPASAATAALRAEVGADWLFPIDGPLTPEVLQRTLAAVRRRPAGSAPDLRGRDWSDTAQRHLAAYSRAVDARDSRSAGARPYSP